MATQLTASADPATGVARDRKRSELAARLISGFGPLPVIIWAIVRGGIPFALVVGLVVALAAHEMCAMALRPLPRVAWLAVAAAVWLPMSIWIDTTPFLTWCAVGVGAAAAVGFASALLAETAAVGMRPVWMAWAVIYVGVPMGVLSLLRQKQDGAWWVVLACTVTWMNDTGAFFSGRALGKHLLLPKASPKKTWEGFFGGLAFAVFFAFFVRAIGFHALPAGDCLAIALLSSVVGPMGDLSESLLKRMLGVKDSGRVLPGHGGMLDRIDALLFNAVLLYAYAALRGLA